MDLRNAPRVLACTAGLLFFATSAFCQKTNLASFVDLDGGQHVFFQDANFNLNQLFYISGPSWSDQNLTALYGGTVGSAESPLTAYVDVDGGEHIFYVDTNGDLSQLFYVVGATSWMAQDLTALYGGNKPAPGVAPSGQATGDLTSYIDSSGGQHVAFGDANGHVNQVFYEVGGAAWNTQDLTASYGGTPATGTHLTAWSSTPPVEPLDVPNPARAQEHIAYLDTNSNLNQLVYVAGGAVWVNQNLTQNFGGNTPAAGSALANFTDSSGFAHIVYLDANQHVNQFVQLSFQVPAQWAPQDLTASYGGNLPSSGSKIAAWNDIDGVQHIAYLDANQNVNQLVFVGGIIWGTENLTQIFGGTKAGAASSLSVYQTGSGGTQNIVYVDANEHVSQLFNLGFGMPWMPQDLTVLYGGNAPAIKVVRTGIGQ